MRENPLSAPFCHNCGMPIGMIATIDPIQQIYSTGWVYRRVISGGRWPLGLVGMWLIFGPAILITPFLVGSSVTVLAAPHELGRSWAETIFIWSVWLFLIGLYPCILYRSTKSYIRHRQTRSGRCSKCGHSRTNTTESRCPECGEPLDPGDSPEDLPDETASLPTADWVPSRSDDIDEGEFPVSCAECGCPLVDCDEEGFCPRCGAAFVRRERLFELYGPEVFLPGSKPPPRPAVDFKKYRAAIVLTILALAALPISRYLTEQGHILFDRWFFVLLLFIVAGAEWVRASHGGD